MKHWSADTLLQPLNRLHIKLHSFYKQIFIYVMFWNGTSLSNQVQNDSDHLPWNRGHLIFTGQNLHVEPKIIKIMIRGFSWLPILQFCKRISNFNPRVLSTPRVHWVQGASFPAVSPLVVYRTDQWPGPCGILLFTARSLLYLTWTMN